MQILVFTFRWAHLTHGHCRAITSIGEPLPPP